MAGAAAYSIEIPACGTGLSVTVDLETLRRDLEANNGMPGLEILLLSEHGRRICDLVVTDGPLETGCRNDSALKRKGS